MARLKHDHGNNVLIDPDLDEVAREHASLSSQISLQPSFFFGLRDILYHIPYTHR